MKMLLSPNNLISLSPFIWSREPCDIPIIRIKNKQTSGVIVKLPILKNIIVKKLQNKKKIKE